MTAQEHANAIWRAEPSPEALAGAISAYTDELRGELHRLTAENAALKEEVGALRLTAVSLREAANRPDGSLSLIHQCDAKACCEMMDSQRADLATAQARIAELEGAIQSAVPVMEHILSIFDHPTRGVNYLDRDKFAAALAAISTQAPSK